MEVPQKTLPQKTADRIIDYIVENQLPPGGKLPTEKDLSAMLCVSRSVMREALSILSTMHIIRSDGNGRCGAIPHRSRLPTIKIVFESAVDDQFDGFIGRRRSHSDSRWKYSPHATQHGCSRSSNHTTGFPCLQYVNVINHSVPFPE